MIECSFCHEEALKYLIEDDKPVKVYAYCNEHVSKPRFWLALPSDREITESEYLLYLAMDTL